MQFHVTAFARGRHKSHTAPQHDETKTCLIVLNQILKLFFFYKIFASLNFKNFKF